ncbi:KaiC domain-containing protein [Salinirubrum litoreum]|uniref:KaiC domain-containing protein n=1 Tax=Salinirubrum litoreum TaxID=1126234 RepID=A0ABD5RDA0_9EURY
MSDEDDDWFERALREQESAGSDEEAGGESDPSDDGTPSTADTDAGSTSSDTTDAQDGVGDGEFGDPSAGASESGGHPAADESESAAGMSPSDGDAFPGAGGDNPFDEDFETAFQNAPEPGGTGEEGGFGGGGGGNSGDFGGGTGGGGAFGGGGDDFGFGDFGGGGEDFGFGDFGGGSFGETDFDDEEYDSDIDRIEVGIEGLDEMILGGVPERSLMVVIGSAGTGKTTFGLQFLREALLNDEKAVYISLEESREQILSTAEDKGWSFRQYAEEERLAVVDLDPIEMANSLSSIRNDLPRLIDDFGADRLVLDSVSLLEMMYDNTAARRSEVFDFTRSLKQAGVTTMLTSEANEDNAYASRHGIVEYLTDAVFILQYVRPSDFRETRLAVEIQKIRDANHSRETKPYEITNDGISVYRQANIF